MRIRVVEETFETWAQANARVPELQKQHPDEQIIVGKLISGKYFVHVAISPQDAAKALRSIKSESRAEASRVNGKLGGPPRKYPQCTRYKAHRFVNDRCPCGYERKTI